MERVSFWLRALKTIPSVWKNQWERLDIIAKWLVASRSAVFVMTTVSAMIGGILAFHYTGHFDPVNFSICLIGLIFGHGIG